MEIQFSFGSMDGQTSRNAADKLVCRWRFTGKIHSGQPGFQAADMLVPFGLNRLNRPDDLLKGLQSTAALEQCLSLIAMFGMFENKMGQRPPMEIIQVEVLIHAGTTSIRDDLTQRNNAAVAKVLFKRSGGGDFIDPPDGIGIGVDSPNLQFVVSKLAG